jgi:Ni/Co efflux regulator RcnB
MSLKSTLTVFSAAALLLILTPGASHADNWHGNNNNWNNNGWHDHDGNNGNHNGWHDNDRDDHNGRGNVERIQPRVEHIVYYRPAPTRVIYTAPPVYYRPVIYRPAPPRYFVGQRYVYYQPVPQPVLVRLRPAPYGYYYTRCDDNIFLVSQRDNVITEIFSALLF